MSELTSSGFLTTLHF